MPATGLWIGALVLVSGQLGRIGQKLARNGILWIGGIDLRLQMRRDRDGKGLRDLLQGRQPAVLITLFDAHSAPSLELIFRFNDWPEVTDF
jgi:hypothetical protein